MSPFQQFRMWARRAPAGERVAAVLAALLVAAGAGWLTVPARSTPRTVNTSGLPMGTAAPGGLNPTVATGPGAPGGPSAPTGPIGTSGVSHTAPTAGSGPNSPAGGSTGTAGTGQNSNSGGSTGGASSASAAASARCRPGTDQGASTTQIKVAITILQVVGPAGNSIAGIPSPSEQQEDYAQVINSINASGGAACRKLVPTYYTVNPADQADLAQTCANIEQAGPFAVVDAGAYALNPSTADCYPRSHIPYFYDSAPPKHQQAADYPYLFSTSSLAETLYRNTVFALKQLDWFDQGKGFAKLGIIYRDCEPAYLGEFEGWLRQAGVTSAQTVAFDMGCSSAIYAPPSEVEQAVLTFQSHHVSNVVELNDFTDVNNFTDIAAEQGFHPRYAMPNDDSVPVTTGNPHANYSELANAIAITNDREGEATTPGYVPSAGTTRCNALLQRQGRPPVYQQEDGYGGTVCNNIWLLVAAVEAAPVVNRAALAAGIEAAGTVDFSYPFGPNRYSGAGVTTGGEFWRPLRFVAGCGCWRVATTAFAPSFP